MARDKKTEPILPDHYGTGCQLKKSSGLSWIPVLLLMLLGTNLITLAALLGRTQRQGEGEVPAVRPGPAQTQETRIPPTQEQIQKTLCPGLVQVSEPDGTSRSLGVILNENGYILTNSAMEEQDLRVTLSDGTGCSAQLLGQDPACDLAVIKIDAEDLSPAELGSCEGLSTGDRVLLYSSFRGDLEQSVLVEISLVNEQQTIAGLERRAFRTECGRNSLLLDDSGKILAIGTQRMTLPIEEALALSAELIVYGTLDAPDSFGLDVTELDEGHRSYWKLPGGVVVDGVSTGGNAERAGLQSGDILTAIGDRPVTDLQSYWKAVESARTEASVRVAVYRGGELLYLVIEPGG